MKDITIIMPFLNEEEEPKRTIESIYETANPRRFQILAIDDASDKNIDIPNFSEVTYIRNNKRIGVDGCRQLGADIAETPYLFIIDAHMRFSNGWMSRVIESISSDPKSIWCTTCIGLGYGNMDLHRSRDYYKGADMVLENNSQEILEPKWRTIQGTGAYPIPCVLGANYGVSRDWFQYIRGLHGLRMWGGSEMFMSLKSWLAGGSCKINADVKIGHKFRDEAPYSTGVWNLIYNKIFICKTILPENLGEYLLNKIPKNINSRKAFKEIEKMNGFIESEKKYYSEIFTRDFKSVCRDLNISMPIC